MNSGNRSLPSIPEHLQASEAAEGRGEFAQALAIVEQALAHYGEHAELLVRRAQLLTELRRRPEALATAYRAAQICPPDARLLHAIAKIHLQRNDPADAKPLLLRAVALAPEDPAVLYDTGVCHFYLNEMEEAAVLLEKVLQLAPGNGYAMHIRCQLRTQTREANNVDNIRRALQRPRLRLEDAILGGFALAKELEDIGEYAESFEALREANRLKRSQLDYDVRSDEQAMQNVARHYTRAALEAIRGGDDTAGPIFIVGMPRTGTTLVERMLASHSDVTSLGEIVDFPVEMTQLAERTHRELGLQDPDLLSASLRMDFAALGRNYLEKTQPLAKGRRHTIDKLPFNFRYCGLIHRALPNAKIVHLTRDPLDTCYAVFKTLFINAYHFSYQLDELARFYVAYRRMMAHWHEVLPGTIYDVSYEELVADPSAQARRLLDWCGLPWQDSVLEFHRSRLASTTASAAQVRRPVYRSSVSKWRNFERQLQPVREILAAAGVVDADGNPLPAAAAPAITAR